MTILIYVLLGLVVVLAIVLERKRARREALARSQRRAWLNSVYGSPIVMVVPPRNVTYH